ncbi:MAG TPA: hypothetical protein V6C81_28835 [Planktothrix sp.]|jgi:hypothetical protein
MTDQLDLKASKLHRAVIDHRTETALVLLESVGGSCQARQLAKRAESNNLNTVGSDVFDWTLNVDIASDKETLSLYRKIVSGYSTDEPVASLTQVRCKM